MTFVTADSCRAELESLTRLLVAAFPGSTVYQHTDLLRVSHDVLNNKVDAVFLEAAPNKTDALDYMKMLHRQKPEVPVFIISNSESFRRQAEEAGASGCFVLPECEQQLVSAVRAVKDL